MWLKVTLTYFALHTSVCNDFLTAFSGAFSAWCLKRISAFSWCQPDWEWYGVCRGMWTLKLAELPFSLDWGDSQVQNCGVKPGHVQFSHKNKLVTLLKYSPYLLKESSFFPSFFPLPSLLPSFLLFLLYSLPHFLYVLFYPSSFEDCSDSPNELKENWAWSSNSIPFTCQLASMFPELKKMLSLWWVVREILTPG